MVDCASADCVGFCICRDCGVVVGMTKGMVRGADGFLQWHGSWDMWSYKDPGEAVKTWWAGELRCGCTEEIFANHHSSPCGAVPKYDPDANGNMTKCGKHSASAKAKRKAAQDARYKAWREKWEKSAAIDKATRQLEPALRNIAEGHNDARGLAREIIAALDAARGA